MSDQESSEPMTETVLTPKGFDFQEHSWTQYGYTLECPGDCRMGLKHGNSIPDGMMLTGKKGAWKLESE